LEPLIFESIGYKISLLYKPPVFFVETSLEFLEGGQGLCDKLGISKVWVSQLFFQLFLTVAVRTVAKHVLHYRQLYEQLRMKKATSIEMASILGLYVKR
jgi:hypothetical protein